MKVLLAIEPNRVSLPVLRMFSKLQLPGGSDLFLLHVTSIPRKFTSLVKERILKISQRVDEIEKDVFDRARQFLGTIEKRFSGHRDIHVQGFVTKGVPGEEILRMIDRQEVDLVVLGTRGFSKATGFMLGSVSQWIVHESPCSVLIARNPPDTNKNGGGMNLLLATDGSSDARAAVDFLQKLRFPSHSQLTILHVIKRLFSGTAPVPATHRTQQAEFVKLSQDLQAIHRREASRLFHETRLALNSSGLKIIERIAFGDEAHEILKAAQRTRADLIVVGSRGLTGVRRLFLGSVSDHVVHNAACSVAVIRNTSTRC
jgi:nucleotide-binding universal stress UspA family protein